MTIGTRLTVWYAVMLLGSLLALGSGLYDELIMERKARAVAGLPAGRVEEEIQEILFFYALPTVVIPVADRRG